MESFGKICLVVGGTVLAGYVAYKCLFEEPEVESYQRAVSAQQRTQDKKSLEALFAEKPQKKYEDYERQLELLVKENPAYQNKLLRRHMEIVKTEGVGYDGSTKIEIIKDSIEIMEEKPEAAEFLGPKAKTQIIKPVLEQRNYTRQVADKAKNAFDYVKDKGKELYDTLADKFTKSNN